MRRAERLFQIIQILRRTRKPVIAEQIARELETSRRSVYRDIAALVGQRVPIRGEAGIGYVLEDGFDLPPLMLTTDELEAAVLGAQWVAGHAEPALARAARDLIAKIEATVPAQLRPLVRDSAARTSPGWRIQADGLDVAQVRSWARAGRKIDILYRDSSDRESRRRVWPIAIGYMEAARVLIGWCELREDFRSFRADRVLGAEFLDERFPARPALLRRQWLQRMESERAAPE